MKRILLCFLFVCVLSTISMASVITSTKAASAKASTPNMPAGFCTPGIYHVVDHQEFADGSGYVEILADGCGWVQAHVHSYSGDQLQCDLVDANSSNFVTTKVVNYGQDCYTIHIQTNGNPLYAIGNDSTDGNSTSAFNGTNWTNW